MHFTEKSGRIGKSKNKEWSTLPTYIYAQISTGICFAGIFLPESKINTLVDYKKKHLKLS